MKIKQKLRHPKIKAVAIFMALASITACQENLFVPTQEEIKFNPQPEEIILKGEKVILDQNIVTLWKNPHH